MKNDYRILGWLIANLVLLCISMLMTWFMLGFEPPPSMGPISGWDFIFTRIISSITLSVEYGLSWLWILSFLQGVGGIFIMLYVAFRIFTVIGKRGTRTKSRVLSIALMVVIAVFLLSDFAPGSIRLPWPGYWLFILGVLSSSIFEWRNSLRSVQNP